MEETSRAPACHLAEGDWCRCTVGRHRYPLSLEEGQRSCSLVTYHWHGNTPLEACHWRRQPPCYCTSRMSSWHPTDCIAALKAMEWWNGSPCFQLWCHLWIRLRHVTKFILELERNLERHSDAERTFQEPDRELLRVGFYNQQVKLNS